MDASNEKENVKTPQAPDGENAAAGEAKQDETPNLPDNLAAAYQKAVAEKQEFYDLALRARAELENFRKRTQREKEEFLQHANADLMRALLPALDGFDRALKHRDPKAPAKVYEGLELIHRQLLETLGRAGLKAVETEGETFDPNLHQAVETVESDQHRDQEIVEELQRGYKLKHRLLRPAIVKVAVHSKKAEPPDEAGTRDE
ncbi:MAG: nucleotide exchange factor GrpE [Terriglobia bacterium]